MSIAQHTLHTAAALTVAALLGTGLAMLGVLGARRRRLVVVA